MNAGAKGQLPQDFTFRMLLFKSLFDCDKLSPCKKYTRRSESDNSFTNIIFSMVVCLRCLLHHSMSLIAYAFRQNREFVFIIIAQFMMSANSRIRFGLQIVLICLYITPSHYHHYANLSEDIELVGQSYFVECVSKIKHILSVIHFTICGAVCFQFTQLPCDDWENIYTLSHYHRQIGSMNYELLSIA